VDTQRQRILEAAAAEFVERGYAATSVDSIAARARIGKARFYRSFENRQQCFLALFDFVAGEAARRIEEAAAPAPDWPARIAAALRALFEFAAEQPLALRACLGEAFAAGPTGIERYERMQEEWGRCLRDGRALNPRGEDLPASLERTLSGGVFWALTQWLNATQQRQSLDDLYRDTLRFLLTPYLGEAGAYDAM